MSSRNPRSSSFVLFLRSFLLVLVFGTGFSIVTAAQEPDKKTHSSAQERQENRPYLRDQLNSNWNLRGRSAPPGESAAALRYRAYRQKMAFREQRAAARKSAPLSAPSTSIAWTSAGPAPLASDATGDGQQDYNWVSGRATSVLIDPADAAGNTVLLGGAYGGLWRSTNAGSLSSNPASVTWSPLIDDQPTLAVGAIALQPRNSNVILVGTGETNSSGDSYYGLGILRSTDGGVTWTQITSAASGQSFLGIGFSKIAFSTSNPSVVVAGTAGDNGLDLGLEEDANSTARGLYSSLDAGATWNRVVLSDGAIPASVTSVLYDPKAGSGGTFYAWIRRHGLYSSTDGQTFTPLATQPTAGTVSGVCPTGSNASSCLIYRGEFAVVPGRNEMYTWVVDVQPDDNGNPAPVDEGIWKTLNGGTSWTQIPDNGITNCGDSAFGPDSGCGVEQGWYNLDLAAIPDGPGTDIYAGAVNLYKCTLEGGTTCSQGDWINLTHVYGCNPGPLGAPAHVHPDQHGIAFLVASSKAVGYFAHDGGISRTLDGYSDLNAGSCTGTNQFDSLSQSLGSQSLGSMTEFVSLSIHPTDADIMLGGTQDNGSPKTSSATGSTTWQNALGGDGGFSAINPANPSEWFASNPYVTILKCELGTDCNDAGFFQVVSSATLGGDQGAFYTPYILDPQNSGWLLVGTCRVWRVSTSGSAPLQLSNDFDTLGTGSCTGNEINLVNGLAASGPADENGNSTVVYAVTNGYGPLSGMPGGEVWSTTNAGTTAMANVTQNETQNVNPNGYAISSVAIDPSDATGQTAYVGIMGFSTPQFPTSHVWKTTNAGASWADWSGTGLPDCPVNALLVDAQAGLIYAGTDVGVFVSSTATPSWIEAGPTPGPTTSGFLPDAPVTALQMFNPNAGTKTLVASTYGRGIWNYALVTSPDYSNTISNSPQTIFATQTATFNGTLTAKNGYASSVNLTCTGVAPLTCTPQPARVTPTAAYAINASGTAGDYSFNAHAVGTDGDSITHDAPATLHIVDFDLTAPVPNALSVDIGGTSAPGTFQVTAAGSFAGTVALTCPSGLPAGAACVFSPAGPLSPTASTPVTVQLAVTAGAGTPVGGPTTVTISATTTGAPAAKTQTFSLTVTGPTPDFAIAVVATPTSTLVNQNVTWNGTLTALNGYNSSVHLSCSAGAPATCSITPSTVTPTPNGAVFAVTLASATTGVFSFTLLGTDGTRTHATATETLTVGTDFTWTDTGGTSVVVSAGQSANYSFSAEPGSGTFSSTVGFACSGLPQLSTCAFVPSSIVAGSVTTPVTVTVSTTGPSSAGRMAGTFPSSRPYFMLSFGIVGIFGLGLGRCKPRLCWMILLGIALLATISCGAVAGGGGGGGVTPPGTSQITVTATEAGGASHGDVVTLVVQ
ncbi:MAG TPA: sialidase family protein [Terriglobales bacterium]|nr:sialidase family protein [Terriglobales bacterium]